MALTVSHLRCNLLENPLGVETPQPLFYWQTDSDQPEQAQAGYRLQVASHPELLTDQGAADLWDSGQVASPRCVGVVYQGASLRPLDQYYWRVGVQTAPGEELTYSAPATFRMGLMGGDHWKAQWIAAPVRPIIGVEDHPAPRLCKSVNVEKSVSSAVAYICGLGYYELSVNGRKAGDAVLAPHVARYDKALYYDALDVTQLLRDGQNELSVILGNGFYCCLTDEVWDYRTAEWIDRPKLIAELHIEYADGRRQVVLTDSSWMAGTTPITFNALRNGEFYDARLEDAEQQLEPAVLVRLPGGELKNYGMPPMRVTEVLKPVSVCELRPGTFMFDVGQNLAGWARLHVKGQAGQTYTVRYGERLTDQGELDIENIGSFIKSGEFQTDKYTCKGSTDRCETWEPRFTYHGFQYVEVSGGEGLTLDSIEICRVHTDFTYVGSFECDDPTLNRIHQCTVNATISNYHGMPTDCPHREKNGWTGDAAISVEQVLLNFDSTSAYGKWMQDFKDAQRPSGQLPGIIPTSGWGYNWGSGPAWDCAIAIIPWNVYVYTGDSSVLESVYPNILRYLDFCGRMADGDIVDFGLGDWCPPRADPSGHKAPTALSDTAFYYHAAWIAAQAAEVLGHAADREKYAALARRIRSAFCRKFVDFEKIAIAGDCQTSTSFSIFMGLIDKAEAEPFIQLLLRQVEECDGHIDCGILGAKAIFNVLSDYGHGDVAYAMATVKTFPSYAYWLELGATTLWESWEGHYSRNHHMFSDIDAWLYKRVGGIQPDPECPGFKHIFFQPDFVRALTRAKATHRSRYGQIESQWEVGQGTLTYAVIIPTGCSGTMVLPQGWGRELQVDGQSAPDANRIELGAGRHVVTCLCA